MVNRSWVLIMGGCFALLSNSLTGQVRFSVGSEGNNGGTGSSTVVSFRQGVSGYCGAVDSEVWALAPSTILESNPNASTDADNDGGESQVVMRFEQIIGDERGQVPPRSMIISARLLVSAFDQGTTVNLHRMLVPFGRAATWNSLVSGVSADGLEASRQKDGFTFGKIAANSSQIAFDVTDTVQLWVNGQPNHGWVFLNTGGNGWDFYTSEFDKIEQRPLLTIEFARPHASQSHLPNGTSNRQDSQGPSIGN